MKTNTGSWVAIVLFVVVAIFSVLFADVIDGRTEANPAPLTGSYSPPISQPEIDNDYESVRQMVEAGMPVLIQFNWSESGMAILDDYGYLNVEVGDILTSTDFVRVACIAYYNDAASGEDVFNCGPFYGRWYGENNDSEYSFDAGYIRSFMVRATDMKILFTYGGYAIR
jgi:hypothetical protein